MSKFLKVMIVLLTIAAFAAPAMSATIVEKDGFKYTLAGDIQIQFDQNGGDDDDLIIEYDDLEIKNKASYQIDDSWTVWGAFDFSGNAVADGTATLYEDDEVTISDKNMKFEEAHIGVSYNNVSFKYGYFDNIADDFGVECSYENTFSGDAFDYAGVANGGGNTVQLAADFEMFSVTVAHELESDTRDPDTFTNVGVTFSLAGFSLAATYADVDGDDDAYGVSASYDAGVVKIGADYSTWEDQVDCYNISVKAPVGEKAAVGAGFNSEEFEGDDDTYDSFYVNGSYKLASGVKAFAEVRDSDNRDDVAYTAGLQVKF